LLKQEEDKGNALLVDIDDWLKKAFPLYAKQRDAASNPQKLDEVNREIAALWQPQEAKSLLLLILGTQAVPQRREATLQLALCKQEQAERLQLQAELAPENKDLAEQAVAAWKEAANLWDSFLTEFGKSKDAGFAALMLGRSQLLSGDREAAIQTWRNSE